MNDTANTSKLITACGARFKFACPKNWERLSPTEDRNVRHCDRCEKNVYLCTTPDEWDAHARRGDCVAIVMTMRGVGEDERQEPSFYVGEAGVPYSPKK